MVKVHFNPILGTKKQAYVVLSFPCKGINSVVLEHMKYNQFMTPTDPQGVELTVMLLSLYQFLEFKLNGSIAQALKTKLCETSLCYQDGEAIITITCEPSYSAIRKILSMCVKNLDPSKLGRLYKERLTVLKEPKFSALEMVGAEAEIASGISKNLEIYITGMYKLPEGGQKILEDLSAEIASSAVILKDGKKPSEFKGSHPDKLKADSAFSAFLAHQYLHTKMVETELVDGGLLCKAGCKAVDKADVGSIERFATSIAKLGDKAKMVLILLAVQTGAFSSSSLKKLEGAALTEASLKASLKKTFA